MSVNSTSSTTASSVTTSDSDEPVESELVKNFRNWIQATSERKKKERQQEKRCWCLLASCCPVIVACCPCITAIACIICQGEGEVSKLDCINEDCFPCLDSDS
ncbi:MAG: hypothetical protein K940chlam3_01303 [Chlamydiae bacterium]|nr:hypothetical protein [Chlamydiota bacterium]